MVEPKITFRANQRHSATGNNVCKTSEAQDMHGQEKHPTGNQPIGRLRGGMDVHNADISEFQRLDRPPMNAASQLDNNQARDTPPVGLCQTVSERENNESKVRVRNSYMLGGTAADLR